MQTYALFPGRATYPTYCEIVEADSFAEALTIANAPEGTTGHCVSHDIAFEMCEHGIATWPQREGRRVASR
jgi:hypothetical protein